MSYKIVQIVGVYVPVRCGSDIHFSFETRELALAAIEIIKTAITFDASEKVLVPKSKKRMGEDRGKDNKKVTHQYGLKGGK